MLHCTSALKDCIGALNFNVLHWCTMVHKLNHSIRWWPVHQWTVWCTGAPGPCNSFRRQCCSHSDVQWCSDAMLNFGGWFSRQKVSRDVTHAFVLDWHTVVSLRFCDGNDISERHEVHFFLYCPVPTGGINNFFCMRKILRQLVLPNLLWVNLKCKERHSRCYVPSAFLLAIPSGQFFNACLILQAY